MLPVGQQPADRWIPPPVGLPEGSSGEPRALHRRLFGWAQPPQGDFPAGGEEGVAVSDTGHEEQLEGCGVGFE